MSAHFKENIVNYFYNKSLYIKKKNLLIYLWLHWILLPLADLF